MMRAWVLTAWLFVASLPAVHTAAQSVVPGAPSLGSAAGAHTTPSSEVLDLRRDLERIVGAAGGGSTRMAVLVLSLDRGDTLVSLNADVPLSPASNMKLYSTAAALYYLGPTFRFSTYLFADGPIGGGVLEGDLILYGTGDPAISGRLLQSAGAPFREFADSLSALGVRVVRGDVIGDASYFNDDWVGPGWLDSDLMAAYGAPVGALGFNENVVTLRVEPGQGGLARIATIPATRGLAVENRVRTVSSGSTQIRVSRGSDRLVVSGQIRTGAAPVVQAVPVVDPANYAAAALVAVLEQRGIRVEGRVKSIRDAAVSRVPLGDGANRGASDRAAPRAVAVHLSPTVAELVRVTNHVSQNMYAEALLKSVGRAASGSGSFAGGTRAVRYLIDAEVAPGVGELALIDGSGLSRTNRLTARATVHLLEFMSRSDVGESYSSSLPAAGSATGLRRMFDSAAAGNLRAKTGTIRNVSSLGGYVVAANGERLVFSIMTNGIPETPRAKQAEDQIGIRLARFRR